MQNKWLNGTLLLVISFGVLLVEYSAGFAQSAINLIVHYVEGDQLEDEMLYRVNAYFSVLDGSGNPIKGLEVQSFVIQEDSREIEIDEVGLGYEKPFNVVFAVDTSRDTSGIVITDVRSTLRAFVTELKSDDQVAIFTFDKIINGLVDFTRDRGTVLNGVETINRSQNIDTCLYDAAYAVIQSTSRLPSANRAVILLTDGIDETSVGAICSIHTADDVINLALSNETRTPVYLIGMGNRVDRKILERIADQTGGKFFYSSNSSELNNALHMLLEQLKFQYILTYTSDSVPGSHNLSLTVSQFGNQDLDTRGFWLPEFNTQLLLLSPEEGDSVSDFFTVSADFFPSSNDVFEVRIVVNDVEVGVVDAPPYEYRIDLSQYEPGLISILVSAVDVNGNEITSKSTTVVHSPPEIIIEPSAPPITNPTSPSPSPAASFPTDILWGIGFGFVGIIAIMLFIFNYMRQQRREIYVEIMKAYDEKNSGPRKLYESSDPNKTPSSFRNEPLLGSAGGLNDYGVLIVEASDDESLVGRRYPILRRITLGRSVDNDVVFLKDAPVSRKHAIIFEKKGELQLKQVESLDASGNSKLPNFGTSVNGDRLGMHPVSLKNNDEILLGKRVRLRVIINEMKLNSEALTSDASPSITEISDPDGTVDENDVIKK